MRTNRIAMGIALVNFVLLVFLLAQFRRVNADSVAPVLRGRALEIVDEQGRVRASISVHGPTTVAGKLYPETVLLRMSDPKSGPVVKLTAAANGSALGLSDDSDSGVQIYARDTGSFVRVVDRKGKEQVLKPR